MKNLPTRYCSLIVLELYHKIFITFKNYKSSIGIIFGEERFQSRLQIMSLQMLD